MPQTTIRTHRLASPMVTHSSLFFDTLWETLQTKLTPIVESHRSDLKRLNISVKADSTFLTEADLNVQSAVVDAIRSVDPSTPIIAEEDDRLALRPRHADHSSSSQPIADAWIIDPIDGTSQFIAPNRHEFCTAVAYVHEGMPVAALVIAYEAGPRFSPITITADVPRGSVCIDGQEARGRVINSAATGHASLGQDGRAIDPLIGDALRQRGYKLKTATTSQTLDILRTSGPILPVATYTPFDLFYRESQKIWDGVPGMCVAIACGRTVSTLHAEPHLPIRQSALADVEPKFRSTIIGQRPLVAEIAGIANPLRNSSPWN